ncbi:MAG: amidase [Deltaproteobacteria bacterium]
MDPFSSALELASAISRKEIGVLEAVDSYLERVDRLNPELNAVVWRRDEDLRREAEEAQAAVLRGDSLSPFHGVPMPVKDLTDVQGWPTTFGSKAARDRISTFTANVVENFKKAGFLLAYRTNTPEFGTLCVTENDLYGATRNPWNPAHSPGGSSGGSAAAVAAGMAPIGHANDGGGSIRIPAACCGLVGLKPSRGRVSMGPFISDGLHGLVCEGVVTRTVADTAATLDAISAADPGAWYNAPPPERPFLEEVGRGPGRLRVAFSTQSPTGVPVSKACVDAVVETAKVLEDLGHEVFEGAPAWPEPSEIMPMFMVLWNTGGALWDIGDWEQVEPINRALHERSLAIDSSTYVRAVAQMQIYSRIITASWGRDFDFLITPTLAVEPPRVGEIWEGYEDNPEEPILRAGAMVPFTPLFNVTGQPAVSLPLCQAESGLPTGVQVVGGPWDEAGVLRLAAQLEEAMPWRDRRPAIA